MGKKRTPGRHSVIYRVNLAPKRLPILGGSEIGDVGAARGTGPAGKLSHLVASAPLPASCSSFRPRHVSLPRLPAVILSCNYTLTSFSFIFVFFFLFLVADTVCDCPEVSACLCGRPVNPGLGNDLA